MSFEVKYHSRAARALIAVLLVAGVVGALSAPAFAAEEARPGWELMASTKPAYLKPGGRGLLIVKVANIGAASSSGAVTVTDTLPPGVTAVSAGGLGDGGNNAPGGTPAESGEDENVVEEEVWSCSGNGPGGAVAGAGVVTCVNGGLLPTLRGGGGTPTGPEAFVAGTYEFNSEFADPEVAINVKAPASEGTIAQPNRATIAGGGAPTGASTQDPITVSAKAAPFGFNVADAWFSNADGTVDTQAGSHPYEATFSFQMNDTFSANAFPNEQGAEGEIRNLAFDLPPGFIGDPYAVPMCTRRQLDQGGEGSEGCPPASQVGIIAVEALGSSYFLQSHGLYEAAPVFNMVPPAGEPAELAFQIFGINTILGTEVRSGGDYALKTQVNNIAQKDVLGSILTLWGEPGNPSHSAYHIGGAADIGEKPYLTLPTSCEGPQEYSLTATRWETPLVEAHASLVSHNANGEPAGFTGCEHLNFDTSLSTKPDTSNADTPAGLTVEVKPALGGLLFPSGLGTSDIKETTVTLPQGVVINPGQAAGLKSCEPGEDGLTTPAEEAEGREDSGPPSCPLASKVGTDEITLPILKNNLVGDVYVLQSDPPHLKLLIAASGEGVNVKLVAEVNLNEQTGQLVTTVTSGYTHIQGIPQAPVSAFKLSFSGGAQAALDTPTKCGTYTAESEFNSWASPVIAKVFPTSTLAITAGANGAPCPPSPLPYTPEMIAGSTTDQAGGYTAFSLLLRVPDDQQRTSRLQFKTPEGLLGMIGKVPLCTNAQAESNQCPAASQIGHTVVQSGPGPYPLVIPEPGQPAAPIYLTEGYGGGSYGLSIVVPLHVGPFELPTQRVRAAIDVDPLTSQLTITTDPLPQVVAGVPTDLRTINAVIDKPGFMFNPTGCESQSFNGTAYGSEGAQAPIGSHFQMGSCRALKFQPNFKVSTSAKTSRADGASLGVKIVYPTGELGANQASSQSNIQKVKVELPKDLPSRLSTLQKACTAAQFNANPAGCPAASVVGTVKVITPVLPVPLTGPAYFVSNGGEAWPNLIIVLQGYGVTIHVVGDTLISKAGITSSTFKAVPDVPIQSFELNLPEGPYSALTALGNLCNERKRLVMPTEFVGQNGAEVHQKTQFEVQGCGKAASAKHKTKHKKKHGARGAKHGRARKGGGKG
ncbi:MAG TPA: hypothetical protein VNV42_09970 [Solirubrobacteraceae bacterium]|jgi:uncharacterized repeat protein (TIGR01451 family)|nr:hypothetical protein [Solirubrobacteraceae bacterium]